MNGLPAAKLVGASAPEGGRTEREAVLAGTPRVAGTAGQWIHWGGKGVLAILDQGLFAGANFLTNILLARWLSPEAYGTFVVAYSVLLLFGTLHTAVLTGPMLVFGATNDVREFRRYSGLLVRGHLVITTVMSVILAVAASACWGLGSIALAKTLGGLAVAVPLILLLWLARAACYVCFRPQWAAAGGTWYLLLSVAVIYGVYKSGHLSPAWALVAMGLTSLIVGAGLLGRLRPQWRSGFTRSGLSEVWSVIGLFDPGKTPHGNPQLESGSADSRHTASHAQTRYARWSVASMTAGWAGNHLQYFVLSAMTGLTTVASMRVLDSMLLPFFHAQTGLSRLLTPALGVRARDPHIDLVPLVIRVSVLWAALGTIAYLLVRWFGAPMTAMLYGGEYAKYGHLLAWYGLALIPAFVGEASYSLFSAVLRIDLVFAYQLVFALAALIGVLATARHGLPGIILARIGVGYALWPCVMFSTIAVCAKSRAP